jgi:hypothetical protein
LFSLAATMVIASVALTLAVSQWFLLLAVFVAANMWLYVAVGACPASLLLRRAGVEARCRW